MHLKRTRYYPTFEQAKTLVQENVLVNFQKDTLYDIPYVYACDKAAHFDLEMMDIVVLQDSRAPDKLSDLMHEWNESTLNQFKELFKLHKGREFDE